MGRVHRSAKKSLAETQTYYHFDSDRLVDAVAEYNRYTRTQIRIIDKELENQLISGIFNVGDLDSFIFSLQQLLEVQIDHKDGQIQVKSKTHPTPAAGVPDQGSVET
ncbi:MAG: hypothetical protein P8Y45_13485 [Exilibacterium sp.]